MDPGVVDLEDGYLRMGGPPEGFLRTLQGGYSARQLGWRGPGNRGDALAIFRAGQVIEVEVGVVFSR